MDLGLKNLRLAESPAREFGIEMPSAALLGSVFRDRWRTIHWRTPTGRRLRRSRAGSGKIQGRIHKSGRARSVSSADPQTRPAGWAVK